jgi:hypothetical protein
VKLVNIFSKTGLPSLAIKKKREEKNTTENLLGRKYFHKMNDYQLTITIHLNVFLSQISRNIAFNPVHLALFIAVK